MDQTDIFKSAHPDSFEWMMVSDCLKASLDMLPSPTSDGDGLISFGIPQGECCDVPHWAQG